MKKHSLIILFVVGILLIASSCSKEEELPQGIGLGEPHPASGTSPKMTEEAAKAMQKEKEIDGILSVTLKDLEGNVIDRTFSETEVAAIREAFNESFIMDTAYIEMITGYTMTLALENGQDVFITSYGDEVFIVARIGDGQTYHLGCDLIAKILLGKEE